ncbi:MAG: hypothetical protein R2744_04370 [Bacteroidales bacterium]
MATGLTRYQLTNAAGICSYGEKGDYEKALEELNKVKIVLWNNQGRNIWFRYIASEADIYYRQGQYEIAFGKFDQALADNPGHVML